MHGSEQPKRVVIIGGGLTGLAVANKLLEHKSSTNQSFEIIILESSAQLGGVLKTTEHEGFLMEAGADSFISEKPEALALAQRLGIASQLLETNQHHRRSFIVRKGKLRPVPEGFQLLAPSRFWPFVTTDIFSWRGKARMALELFVPRSRPANGRDETLANFVRRRLGREAFERMAQPMIGGIYTADPEQLSLRATLPRFLEMERIHGSVIRGMWQQRKHKSHSAGVSGARYSLFLSFDRGMQVLVDALAARLYHFAQLDKRVESLVFDQKEKSWEINLAGGSRIKADAVCLAVPAQAAAIITFGIDPELARLLNEIQYASTATINLAYHRGDVPHALDGFGFVVPFIENRSLLACTFSSIKFPGRAPADKVLLRGFMGGALQPKLFDLNEEEILRRARKDLQDLLGIVKAPLFSLVSKWPKSMPQYHLGHLELVKQIRSRVDSLAGLHIAGNSYDGAGIPDCIRSGEAAATKMMETFIRP